MLPLVFVVRHVATGEYVSSVNTWVGPATTRHLRRAKIFEDGVEARRECALLCEYETRRLARLRETPNILPPSPYCLVGVRGIIPS